MMMAENGNWRGLMRRTTVLGIVLMILSIGLLVVWEAWGRNTILLTPVLAASRDIAAGESMLPGDLSTIYVLPETIMQGALQPEESSRIAGRTVVCPLRGNQQLTAAFFRQEEDLFRSDQSIFPIAGDWIGSMSSAVRPGDVVRLVSASTAAELGSHRVAYILDRNGRAIRVPDTSAGDLLARYSDQDPVASLEIVCTPEEYIEIFQYQLTAGPRDLIVCMEGGL
jgi:hypothetical protein